MLLRIIVILFAFGIVSHSFAQQRKAETGNQKSYRNLNNSHAREMDVVFYPTADDSCSLTVTLFPIRENWGYVSGTNEYGDKEKAQLLEYEGSATYNILGVIAYFNTPGIVDDGNLTARLYTVGSNGAPDELISVSDPLSVSEVVPNSDTSVEITTFIFPEQPQLSTTQFFVSIDFSSLYESRDTLALFQTELGCGDGTNTYEKWVDDQWVSVLAAWPDSLNPFNVDFLLGALVEFDNNTTSADEFIKHNGLQLYPATPNPASDRTILNYGLEFDQPVRISVFDAQGRQVRSIHYELQEAGRHQEELFVKNLAPGQYYYQIVAGTGRLISRFLVQQ